MVGLIDMDTVDVDLDTEADLDLDAGMEADVDSDLEADVDKDISGASAGMAIAKFFYLGDVPLMILLTIISFSMWITSIVLNHELNADLNRTMSLLLLIPNLILAMFVLKIVGKPIAKVFQSINKDLRSERPMLGMPCLVTTSKVTETFGQAKLETETSPILFNAITKEGEVLSKGDQAVILEFIKEKNTYIITAFE